MTSSIWPYEDVRFSFKGDTLTLTTPWASREIRLRATELVDLEQLLLRRDEIPVSMQRSTYTRLFQAHRHAPFFYLQPRKKDGIALDQAPPVRPLPDDLVANDIALRGIALPAALRLRAIHRDWDAEALLKFSRVEHADAYDPAALFTMIRRLYLLDSVAFDRTDRLRDDVSKYRGTPVHAKAQDLIRFQTQEVQRLMAELLTPAPVLGGTETLKGFAFQEKADPRLLPMTDLLLNALGRIAQANPLAFALARAFLNESSVLPGSFGDALAIAETLPAVSEAYARQTIQASEAISKVLNHVTANLVLEIETRAAREGLAAAASPE